MREPLINRPFKAKDGFLRDAIAAVSSSKGCTTNLTPWSAVFNAQFIHTCLFSEVDGYVGYCQRHQESDERPIVRERREFHHVRREDSGSTANISCSDLEGWEAGHRLSSSECFLAEIHRDQVHPCPPTQQQHHKQWSGAWENRRVTRNFCWRLLHCSPTSGEGKKYI